VGGLASELIMSDEKASSRVCQVLFAEPEVKPENSPGYATAERLLNPLAGAGGWRALVGGRGFV
jgi:hypothetical protein